MNLRMLSLKELKFVEFQIAEWLLIPLNYDWQKEGIF